MKKLFFIILSVVTLVSFIPFSAVPVMSAGTYPGADELARAIQQESWDQAHDLARRILKEQGYRKSGNDAVDWFIDGERQNILGKIQQETVEEIITKNGDDALEGIINVGSHARWNNPKYIPGKSDMDFIFIGKNSADADTLFRRKLAQELGIVDPEDALRLTKIGSTNDLQFSKLQQVKNMEGALQKGQQDIDTFLGRLNNPEMAEYYKTYGGDKFVENYNWQAGSYDKIDAVGGKVTIVRDPGTVSGTLKVAEIGSEPTAAMEALYKSKGWTVPKMDMGDSWGLATNEYYFMQKEMEELAGASASEKAVKLAKRGERFMEALTLAQMDAPANFIAQTRLLRQGGTLSEEASEAYLKELNRISDLTLERTLKAKLITDLNRAWDPEWLTGNLKGEALDATIKFAETRKFLETTFGMNLIGKEKAANILSKVDLPEYYKNIVGDEYGKVLREYGKALELAGDTKQLSRYIENQASRKVSLIAAAEETGETAKLNGFISRFLTSTSGKMTLEGLDVGFRFLTVYDAYKEGGWNAAANRAGLEAGAKWAAWQGLAHADTALLVFDLSTMAVKAVGNAAMEEMRNDNVMGIYTGVIPQREAGWLFIGLKNDVKPSYTSLFDYLKIEGLSEGERSQIRSRLDGNEGFENYIKRNIGWWEWAFGVSDERREEFKDVYVSLTNVNYMRSKLFDALEPSFDQKVKEWSLQHKNAGIFDKEFSAEYDKLVKNLLSETLGNYRTKYLAEIEAGGAWKGLDESTWQQIESMIAKDFETSLNIHMDKVLEEMKQQALQNELNNMVANAGNWIKKLYGSDEGALTRSFSITDMLRKGFNAGDFIPVVKDTVTPEEQFVISISPDPASDGDLVYLYVKLKTPTPVLMKLNIKVINLASGEEENYTDTTGYDGECNSLLLKIDDENIDKWNGENQVTVETIPDSPDIAGQTATDTFTVIAYKLTITGEPYYIYPGEDINLSINITPGIAADIEVESQDSSQPGRYKTNDSGFLKIPYTTKKTGFNSVFVTAYVPFGDDSLELRGSVGYVAEKPYVVFRDIKPDSRELHIGDILGFTVLTDGYTVHTQSGDIPTKLTVSIVNQSGYKQSFSVIAVEGFSESNDIKALIIDATSVEVWEGINTCTVTTAIPSGNKFLTGQNSFTFYVEAP